MYVYYIIHGRAHVCVCVCVCVCVGVCVYVCARVWECVRSSTPTGRLLGRTDQICELSMNVYISYLSRMCVGG